MEKKAWYQVINGFALKLFAFFFMTLDHVAKFLQYNDVEGPVTDVLLVLGRFAFPLFILMMVEGVRHTRNYGKYALRLGIIAALVLVSEIIIHHCFMDIYSFYSPLIDLLVCSCFLYLIKRKDKYSFLAILPLFFIVLSFTVITLENMNNYDIWWFPFYLRSGYNIYALFLSLGFYFAYPLAIAIFKNYGNNVSNLDETYLYRLTVNVIDIFVILLTIFILYLISFIPNFDQFTISLQSWAMCSAIIVFFYNGERGYNKPWFKYGSYLYFPLHIAVIFIIFSIIFH